jgi:hypothetical protein
VTVLSSTRKWAGVLLAAIAVCALPARAEIRVVDGGGAPQPGVRVSCGGRVEPSSGAGVVGLEGCETVWLQTRLDPPLALKVVDGVATLPPRRHARVTLRDGATGRAITSGVVHWAILQAPLELRAVAWKSPAGQLDAWVEGAATGTIEAPGYRSAEIELAPGDERGVALLEPIVDLQVTVTPPAKGNVLWCKDGELGLTSPFFAVARSCELDGSGRATLAGVTKGIRITGVALCPGIAPRLFSEATTGAEVRLSLERGSCVRVAVRGPDAAPMKEVRVLAKGRLAELDGFPWTQESRSGADGAGEVCGVPAGAFVLELSARGMATRRQELRA